MKPHIRRIGQVWWCYPRPFESLFRTGFSFTTPAEAYTDWKRKQH